jgi:hypothetical protein
MGDAAAQLPAGCSAKCTLECDVWSGRVTCGEAKWSVYGGFASMAGMQLDQRDAKVEGREALPDEVSLRWGTGPKGQFCATVRRKHWNWEFCSVERGDQRDSILSFARGYTREFPQDRVISCNNSGC